MGRKYPSDKAEKRRAKRSVEQAWRGGAETYVDEAIADLEERELEGRTYEDAMAADDLVADAQRLADGRGPRFTS